jgi:hypothetical protein
METENDARRNRRAGPSLPYSEAMAKFRSKIRKDYCQTVVNRAGHMFMSFDYNEWRDIFTAKVRWLTIMRDSILTYDDRSLINYQQPHSLRRLSGSLRETFWDCFRRRMSKDVKRFCF